MMKLAGLILEAGRQLLRRMESTYRETSPAVAPAVTTWNREPWVKVSFGPLSYNSAPTCLIFETSALGRHEAQILKSLDQSEHQLSSDVVDDSDDGLSCRS